MNDSKKKWGSPNIKINWIVVIQWLTILVLLAYAQFAVQTERISKVFLASPGMIINETAEIVKTGVLWPHLMITLEEVFVGYIISAAVGITIAFVWVLFPKVEEYMNVFCSAIMAIPKTAILPLLILWFGIGFKSKVVMVFLFSVFQILYNTLTGLKQTEIKYINVARVFRASRLQMVLFIMMPYALPYIFNGLKLAAATALTGIIFSEMQSARAGLGYLLMEAQNLLNSARIYFIIILVTLISIAFVKLISILEYAICHKWQNNNGGILF